MRALLNVLMSGWVFWMNVGFADEFPFGKDKWRIEEAYESRADCHQARADSMKKSIETLSENGIAVKIFPALLIHSGQDGRAFFSHYYCLPAELDPRPRG
ncbi:MAG: hypothetical protein AAB433_01280 [Nitrospirota bacterium]